VLPERPTNSGTDSHDAIRTADLDTGSSYPHSPARTRDTTLGIHRESRTAVAVCQLVLIRR
jgi:hypothetical protein